MYALYKIPFFDHRNRRYKNIIKISGMPKGKLKKYVRRINMPKLSPFKEPLEEPCILAITNKNGELMSIDELPQLFEFLVSNNYKIDTSITKMMNGSTVKFTDPLICFVGTS